MSAIQIIGILERANKENRGGGNHQKMVQDISLQTEGW